MAATEIRAKEASIQITVDGQRLGGSFLTVSDLSIKPDAEVSKKQFTGDKRFRADLDVKGYDFSFKTEKRDHLWANLWRKFERAEGLGIAFPVVTLAVTYSYRDGSGQLKTITLHGDLVIKPDDDTTPGTGYLSNSWSGSCSYLAGLD